MLRLLKINLRRLVKNPLLWIFSAMQVLITIIYTLDVTSENSHTVYKLEKVMFSGIGYGAPIVGLMALFLCLSITGTDYASGGIRNKIIAGYSREAVYVSNLLTAVIGTVIILTIKTIAFCLIPLPILRTVTLYKSYIFASCAVVVLTSLFYCVFGTFVATFSQDAKNAFVRILILYILFTIILILVVNMLPTYYTPDYLKYSVIDGTQDYSTYVLPEGSAAKPARDIMKVMYDAVPLFQVYQISPDTRSSELCMLSIVIFSLFETLALFFGGLLIAKKQNIK